MATDSRPPLSHQRPPLATRLRNSFEGKRSKSEVTSPTRLNGFAVQDPDALQNAVDQAINSETFQNAIAVSLAALIKPSIKSALDTIQPVVEAVYSHDVLLRKTNKSVEDILDRMDTIPEEGNDDRGAQSPRERSASAGSFYDLEFKALLEKSNKRTVATLAELSNAVQSNNSKVAGMEASLGETKESVEYLKAYLQNQLDQVQADIGRIVDMMESERKSRQTTNRDTSLFSSHTTKLDTISTDLAGLKGFSKTSEKLDSIASELNALRASVDAGNSQINGSFTDLDTKLSNVCTVVQVHGTTLEEIKQLDNTSEIMAADQRSNTSHDSHAVVLGEIKERSLAEPTAVMDSSNSEIATVLQELKSHLVSLKENIEAGLTSNHQNVTGLGSKIENVLTTIEGHKATDSTPEILAAVRRSNDSHASHLSALDRIKSLIVVPTDSSNLEALESQISSIITTLDSHTTSLGELKATSPASTELVPSDDTIKTDINTIATTLESHTKLLNEIKDDVSAEILTALHDIGQTQVNHTTTLSEIREADVSDEILTALHTSNEAHSNHESAFEKLHVAVQASNDSHEQHGLLLGEIKSRSLEPAPAQVPVPATESGGLVEIETKLGGIVSILEEHNATLSAIKEAVDSSAESHAAHALTSNEIKEVGMASKDLYESHATVLSEIKDATLASKGLHESHATTLSEIKDVTVASRDHQESHATALSEIKEVATALNGLHESHATALSEIKDASIASRDLHESHATALSEIKEVATASKGLHESHATTLSEIKDATVASKDLHSAHSATLADLVIATGASNEAHAIHTATLAEMKAIPPTSPLPEIPGLAALETDIRSIAATLESQASILSEIKETSSNPELLATVKQSHDVLTSHTSLLDSIKAGSSHENILASISSLKAIVEETRSGINSHAILVKDLHSDTKDSHSSLATTISALAIGGAVGGGAGLLASKDDEDISSKELLEEVKAVREIVEKTSLSTETVKDSVTSITAQIDINHTTVTTSITTLSDELKAEVDASSTEIVDTVTKLGVGIEIVGDEVKSFEAKVRELGDGVHLSEKGLGQLKEHGGVVSVKEVDEHELSREVPHVEEESIPQAAPPEVEEVKDESELEHVAVEPVVEPEPIAAEEKLRADKVLPLQTEASDLEPEVLSKEGDGPEGPLVEAEKPVPEIVALTEKEPELESEELTDSKLDEAETLSSVPDVLPKEVESTPDLDFVEKEESIPEITPVKEEEVSVSDPEPILKEKEKEKEVPEATPTEGQAPVISSIEAEESTTISEITSIKEDEVSAVAEAEHPANHKEQRDQGTPPSTPAEMVEEATPIAESNPILEEKIATEPKPTAEKPSSASADDGAVKNKEIIPESTLTEDESHPASVESTTKFSPIEVEDLEPVALPEFSTKEIVPESKDIDTLDEEIKSSKSIETPETPTKEASPTTFPASDSELNVFEYLDSDSTAKSVETNLKSPPLPEVTDDESELPTALASSASPSFAEESGEVSNEKKGKKGKKEKKGKKGKKEKVAFVMDGDEA